MVAIILRMALDQEQHLGLKAQPQLDKHKEQPDDHSILVLTTTVIHNNVDLLHCFTGCQSLATKLVPQHQSRIVSTLLSIGFKVCMSGKCSLHLQTVNNT
jgi:hypothetical protein